MRRVCPAAAARLLLPPVAAAAAAAAPPNFVILFADDFGWGDLHCFGHPTQERGVIDQLAEQGVRFTQWYSAESICTPSRAALLTGRLPTRMGFPHGVFTPASSQHLPTSDPTIAEMLRPLGYATGMVGKWHLGINDAAPDDGLHLPFYRGFDYVGHILPFSNHWQCDESGRHYNKPNPLVCLLYHNTTLVQQPIDHRNLTETLAADAVGFVEAQVAAARPFLLYFAFPQAHVSMFTGTRWDNTSANGIFGDQVRAMDWAAGEVVAAVDAGGVRERTLIFFTADNGPHVELCREGGTAGPLRGGKSDSSWEGGLRMPGIAYWPGTIPAGAVTKAPVTTMDIFATCVELAGGAVPEGRVIDGRSLAALLRAPESAPPPHDALFHYCGDTLMAVRYGPYKLRYYTEQLPFDNYSTVHCTAGWAHGEFFQGGWGCHGGAVTTNDPPELLDVESDLAERYPLLQGADWAAHLAWRAAAPAPRRAALPYYDEVRRGAAAPCGAAPVATHAHVSLSGYQSDALPANLSSAELLARCTQLCCGDDDCAAAVLQPWSLNHGKPQGACTLHEPCCWRVHEQDASPEHFQPCPNCTVAFPRQVPGPSGPYAAVLRAIEQKVADHVAAMVHEKLPGANNKALQPCCNPPSCTCNYPGQSPP